MFSKHILWCCPVYPVLSPEQQLKNNIFLFLWVLLTFQYLFAYSRYISVHVQEKKNVFILLINVKKTNPCPCIFRVTQMDVVTSTTDLHITYDANVITAVCKKNVLRLVHDKRKTELRFLRASHVPSGFPSPNKTVRDTHDWHVNVHLSYVALSITSIRF